jgi:hypothetical protein
MSETLEQTSPIVLWSFKGDATKLVDAVAWEVWTLIWVDTDFAALDAQSVYYIAKNGTPARADVWQDGKIRHNWWAWIFDDQNTPLAIKSAYDQIMAKVK